jgi:ubiquinone/menaquinone biosynthesis C-methylase UbiE
MIPFYGSQYPDLFAIERAAMDRPGHVLRALDDLLPTRGSILDIGAGNGFYADALSNGRRRIFPLEPDAGMIDRSRSHPWVRGEAALLPFRDRSFDGVFVTWAYFFPSFHSIEEGLHEAARVLRRPGVIAIVNNLGGDEFSALSPRSIAEPVEPAYEIDATPFFQPYYERADI